MLQLTDLNVTGKRVLLRVDLNLPMKDNRVVSERRLQAILPTLQWLLQREAKIMIASHLGSPAEGSYQAALSLRPIVEALQRHLSVPVRLVRDYLQGVAVAPHEVVVLENVRFNQGERKNDMELAQQYAALCDLFVMDAFATAHRREASICGVIHFAPIACAGPLLHSELNALKRVMRKPIRPVVAVIGGSKISTKLPLLIMLAQYVDQLIVGGGMANTLLAAQGYPVGRSLYEATLLTAAKQLLCRIPILTPCDVKVATTLSKHATVTCKAIDKVKDEEYILDIGEKTLQQIILQLQGAQTIIWNGPMGLFELPQCAWGSEMVARGIANSSAFSLAGGGETVALIDRCHIAEQISYISTGGGAFLDFLQQGTLPAILLLEQHAQRAQYKG